MACVSMAMPMRVASQKKEASLLRPAVQQEKKQQKWAASVSGLGSASVSTVMAATSAAVTASMVVPQVAEAAELAPSLNNFLFSILAGGVVLAAIGGAVVGVSYFDPVKRG